MTILPKLQNYLTYKGDLQNAVPCVGKNNNKILTVFYTGIHYLYNWFTHLISQL